MARCLAVAISQAPGLSGTPELWPLFERGDERVLGKFFGHADIAHDSRQAGDEPWPTRFARPRQSHDGCRKRS